MNCEKCPLADVVLQLEKEYRNCTDITKLVIAVGIAIKNAKKIIEQKE